jgi:hypothetical protein
MLDLKASHSALLSYFLMLYPSHPRSPFSSAPSIVPGPRKRTSARTMGDNTEESIYSSSDSVWCGDFGGEMALNM